MNRGILSLFVVVFLIQNVLASNVTIWQGQYFIGSLFQQGTFQFNFTVYGANVGGGKACYSNLTTLTTGNWGEWRTEQLGVGTGCNDVSKNYYLEIAINNETQVPRRLLTNFDSLFGVYPDL